jgi:hypothetical protein
MRVNVRRSGRKPKKMHGFRAKPWSHRPKKNKRKPGGQGNRRGKVQRKS